MADGKQQTKKAKTVRPAFWPAKIRYFRIYGAQICGAGARLGRRLLKPPVWAGLLLGRRGKNGAKHLADEEYIRILQTQGGRLSHRLRRSPVPVGKVRPSAGGVCEKLLLLITGRYKRFCLFRETTVRNIRSRIFKTKDIWYLSLENNPNNSCPRSDLPYREGGTAQAVTNESPAPRL